MGKPYTLLHPIDIDGKKVTELLIRRPKGKDMVIIADHMPALAKLDGVLEEDMAKHMSGDVFTSVLAIVGALTDIGEEGAGELDFADIMVLAPMTVSSLGELLGSDGTAKSGKTS